MPLALLLVLCAPLARAASVHAIVDRSQVSLGDTITLNIQSDGALGTPDLAPLQQDFQVLGTSTSSSLSMVNGRATRVTRLGIALKPRRAGTLVIPALAVGGGNTSPLTVTVGAAPAGGSGRVGDPVFMESDVSPSAPWIGQQVVYTVRLYYLPDVQGSLADPSANGGRLLPLDRDQRYRVERNGYTYDVIERSWAFIPDRAGDVTVAGPAFDGQRTGNLGQLFNDPNALLNNPNALLNGIMRGAGGQVHAQAPEVRLDVRPAPSGAGQPWLPARAVQLKLTGLPADGQAKAGVPLNLVLSIEASGQPADALPEPDLPSIAGARVYPDRSRDHTDASGAWLEGTRTRSFAVIPERDGTLRLPAITLDWWNVADGRREQASLPAHTLDVTGAVAGGAAPAASGLALGGQSVPATASTAAPSAAASASVVAGADTSRFWRFVALASLVLWLLGLGAAVTWWSRRGRHARATPMAHASDGDGSAMPGATPSSARAAGDPRVLRRAALDVAARGDPAACEHAMLAWARAVRPGFANLAAVRDALDAAAQREAIESLQRARWQGADAAAACAAVARAFADGFTWRRAAAPQPDASALPPLYPTR
jgi:hypothetical protein